MRKRIRSLRCPTCRKLVLRDDPEFPFCSERCRTIDLGKWASGHYVVSSPVLDPDSVPDLEAGESARQWRGESEGDKERGDERSPRRR